MKKFGPGFLPATDKLYKIEYALFSVFLLLTLYVSGADLITAVIIFLLPDIVFIPIGARMKRGTWPAWGSAAYNTTHSLAVWLVAAIALWSFIGPAILGWALHITFDRSVGYCLRAKK